MLRSGQDALTLTYSRPQMCMSARQLNHRPEPAQGPLALLISWGCLYIGWCAKVDPRVWSLNAGFVSFQPRCDKNDLTKICTAALVVMQACPSSDHCRHLSEGYGMTVGTASDV